MQLVLQAERNSVEDTNAVAAQEDTFLAMPPLHHIHICSTIPHYLGSHCYYPAAVRWNNQDMGTTEVTWDFILLQNKAAEVCRSSLTAAELQEHSKIRRAVPVLKV